MHPEQLKQALSHVRWIGGSPCSGKSTISKLLGQQYGLIVYNVDDHWDDHTTRATLEQQPLLYSLRTIDWDWVFVKRPLAEQLDGELLAYREEWSLTLADLLALPADRLIIAEGAAMLPELVAPLLLGPNRALWLVPAEQFQRETYTTQRAGFVNWIAGQTSNGALAIKNWMDRDVAFAQRTAASAAGRGLRVEWIDGSRPIPQMAAFVADHFGLNRSESATKE